MRRRRRLRSIVLGALAFGALTAGCTDPLGTGNPPEPSCSDPFTGRELDGDWTLSGSGMRSECESRRLEGELKLSTPMSFDVVAEEQASAPGADASIGGGRVRYVLALGSSAPSELDLTGEAVGACVHFTLTEELEDGDALQYDFDGFITGNNLARGEFTGRGPESCEVMGEFELTVR
jgi:hypothetical protein